MLEKSPSLREARELWIETHLALFAQGGTLTHSPAVFAALCQRRQCRGWRLKMRSAWCMGPLLGATAPTP